MNYKTKYATLYESLFEYRNVFTDMLMVALSVISLAVMANIRIPLWPVPVTLQTFGVFLIAFFFGSKKAFLTIATYILAGIAGFGVFTGYNSGIAALLGPTGGYLIGFSLMALFMGFMIEKGYGRTKSSVLWCMIIGEIILYACGLTGLALFLKTTSIVKVLSLGFVPFIIGDTLKIAAAVQFFPSLWKAGHKN